MSTPNPPTGPPVPPPYGPPPGMPPPPPPKPSKSPLVIIAAVVIAFVVAIGVGLAFAFSGSAPDGGTAAASDPTPDSGSASGGAQPAESAPEPEPTPHPIAGPIQFGEPWIWEDGMTATVASATQFTPGQYSTVQPGQVGVAIDVTFTNNTAAPVDLTLAMVDLRAGDTGIAAESIIDMDAGIGIASLGTIAPGQSATGTYGFAVDPGNIGTLSVTVSPTWNHEDGMFVGAAA